MLQKLRDVEKHQVQTSVWLAIFDVPSGKYMIKHNLCNETDVYFDKEVSDY